jgi:hypothetical protein
LPAAISASAVRAAARQHADKAVELAVEPLDAGEAAVDQLDRRQFALFDQPRRFGDGQEIRHHRSALRKLNDMRGFGGDIASAGRAQPRLHVLKKVRRRGDLVALRLRHCQP